MEVIFNELSACCCYQTIFASREGMHQLIQVMREIVNLGIERTMRTTNDFMSRSLSPSYRIVDWFNDGSVDREQRRYIRSFATRSPFLEELFRIEENNKGEILEFQFNGEPSIGLGMAFLWDTVSVSLDGDKRFSIDPIILCMKSIIKNDDAKIFETQIEVCSITKIENVRIRDPWVRERVRREIRSGFGLWQRKESLLPNLIFCNNTYDQLRNIIGKEPYFPQILRHLFELNRYVSQWVSGSFSLDSISWSEESSQTLIHPKYGPLRRFLCPDGIQRTFSFHSKPTGGNIRIYFYPLQDSKIAYIGYIGDHLPTVKFN